MSKRRNYEPTFGPLRKLRVIQSMAALSLNAAANAKPGPDEEAELFRRILKVIHDEAMQEIGRAERVQVKHRERKEARRKLLAEKREQRRQRKAQA